MRNKILDSAGPEDIVQTTESRRFLISNKALRAKIRGSREHGQSITIYFTIRRIMYSTIY